VVWVSGHTRLDAVWLKKVPKQLRNGTVARIAEPLDTAGPRVFLEAINATGIVETAIASS